MHIQFNRHAAALLAGLLLAVPALTAGCPGPRPAGTAGGKTAGDTAETKQPVSLFEATNTVGVAPDSLDVSIDGAWVCGKFLAPADWSSQNKVAREYLAASFPVQDDGLGKPQGLFAGPDLNRAFIALAPDGQECLLVTSEQQPGGPVVDVLWRARNNNRTQLNYAAAAGIPADGPQDMCFGLTPFYSWDGQQVIVPLNSGGLAIAGVDGKQTRFVAYPDFPARVTGKACGPLPDSDGRRRIFVSLWSVDSQPELCHVNVLDIDSGQWTAQVALDWVVYEIGSSDVDNMPWLARGSRAPQSNTEHQRMPRLALIDPASGATDYKEFLGEPTWEASLDPSGQFIAYMDGMRKGIVRLNVDTGEVDIDRAYFDPEAKLFTSDNGASVLAWNRTMLYRAEFTQHEKPDVGADEEGGA